MHTKNSTETLKLGEKPENSMHHEKHTCNIHLTCKNIDVSSMNRVHFLVYFGTAGDYGIYWQPI